MLTRFLVVAFDRLGRTVMEHESHVAFVDAHSERDCCTDQFKASAQPILLGFRSQFVGKARMVRLSDYLMLSHEFGHVLAVFSVCKGSRLVDALENKQQNAGSPKEKGAP